MILLLKILTIFLKGVGLFCILLNTVWFNNVSEVSALGWHKADAAFVHWFIQQIIYWEPALRSSLFWVPAVHEVNMKEGGEANKIQCSYDNKCYKNILNKVKR